MNGLLLSVFILKHCDLGKSWISAIEAEAWETAPLPKGLGDWRPLLQMPSLKQEAEDEAERALKNTYFS